MRLHTKYTKICSIRKSPVIQYNRLLPLFPVSVFHDLVLLQVFPPLHCHWNWSVGFLLDHLPMKGGSGEILHMGTQWDDCETDQILQLNKLFMFVSLSVRQSVNQCICQVSRCQDIIPVSLARASSLTNLGHSNHKLHHESLEANHDISSKCLLKGLQLDVQKHDKILDLGPRGVMQTT